MKKDLRYFADLLSEPPYVGIFNKRDADDKRLMERSVISEWANSVSESRSERVSCISANDNDPPDFFCELNGKKVSVELKELVDGQLKGEVARRRKSGHNANSSTPDIFNRAQRDEVRLKNELNILVYSADDKYLRSSVEIDVLVIHTAEPWLLESQLDEWTQRISFSKLRAIGRVDLLARYSPSLNRWPIYYLSE